MDKRGTVSFDVLITAFYRFVILFMVGVAMVFFVLHFMRLSLDVFEVESEIAMQSILKSPNGVSYSDAGRVYPGIVEYGAFRQTSKLEERLAKGLASQGTLALAAKIELVSKGTAYKDLAPAYINKERFDAWYANAKSLVPGPGGAKALEKSYPVLVKDSDSYEQAMLRITVVIPNS
jgi:hypothetical protein